MQRFSTLRVRFALWVAALILFVLAAFGTFVYVTLAQGLAASIDDSLRISATQAIAAINIEDGQISFTDAIPSGSAADLQERGLTIRVLSLKGKRVQAFGRFRAEPIDSAAVGAAYDGRSTFTSVTTPAIEDGVRWYTTPITVNGQLVGVLQVAQALDQLHDILERLLTALVVGAPLLAIMAALGGHLVVRRTLRPIDQITRTARHISAQDLHARLDLPATNDEVGRLASTFDDMIGRLDAAFQRERRFVADASHELRTPLAAMEVIIGVTRAEQRTPNEYEQALDDLADETRRLRMLAEDLLRLAHSDAPYVQINTSIDLAELVFDVAATLQPLAEAKQIGLTCTTNPDLQIWGDRDALIRVFANLVDNAIKYTRQGTISVRAARDHSMIKICIADTGIGIAPADVPHIFDRFYRVDAARTAGGTGLGLAIARDLIHAHNGTIEINSTLGVGSTLTVRLPEGEPPAG